MRALLGGDAEDSIGIRDGSQSMAEPLVALAIADLPRYSDSPKHMKLSDILHRTPPKTLYHYTTQQGLLGIINNKEIWASHTQYLNDTSEFRHAKDLLLEELRGMVADRGMDDYSRMCLSGMERALNADLESVNVCVCSFSRQGDSLSQWRAYGGSASGFAIGFSGQQLREMCGESGWLVPVVYASKEQQLMLRALLQSILEENIILRAKGGVAPNHGSLLQKIYRYGPIFKHRSFEEEREWRIVTKPLPCTSDRFSFRPGASMLTPYFRFDLKGLESLGIEEMVIGPTPHPEQSYQSLRSFLFKNGVDSDSPNREVRVRHSEVPYRNW